MQKHYLFNSIKQHLFPWEFSCMIDGSIKSIMFKALQLHSVLFHVN